MESIEKRRYRQKERARRQERTRQRITEAAVALHESVGPARTTVKEIAERAGVGRMTVYNHFPSDRELLAACTGHYMAAHPAPDPEELRAIADPGERLATALRRLYGWYRETEPMTVNAIRDAPLVPALDAIMRETVWPMLDATVEAVGSGDGDRKRAALRLAVDFGTWRTLTGAGLDDEAAVELSSRFVAAAD